MSETTTYQSDHDELKHTLASSLRQYIKELPSGHTGTVQVEERILDGDRRVDVSLHREFDDRSHSWAFEVKATLSDAIGAHAQLSDYADANYTPVLIKKDSLHPTASEPTEIVENASLYGPVATAVVDGDTVEFYPERGFEDDVCLRGIAEFWDGCKFALDVHNRRQNAVLRVLAEPPARGCANPYLIREETDLNKGDTNTVLNRLARAGYVEQVTRGLYEITTSGKRRVADDPREVGDDE